MNRCHYLLNIIQRHAKHMSIKYNKFRFVMIINRQLVVFYITNYCLLLILIRLSGMSLYVTFTYESYIIFIQDVS